MITICLGDKIVCSKQLSEHINTVHVSAQDKPMQSEEFADQVLGLLVTFAHQLDESGITSAAEEDAGDSQGPAVPKDEPVDGATVKAGPPLPPESLKPSGCHGAEVSSSSSGCKSRPPPPPMAPTSKYAPGIPTAPPDYQLSSQSRLVCHPEQMKKFLYGSQKSQASAQTGYESMMII